MPVENEGLVRDSLLKKGIIPGILTGILGGGVVPNYIHITNPAYCWWLKSCTTWDVWNPKNNRKLPTSTGDRMISTINFFPPLRAAPLPFRRSPKEGIEERSEAAASQKLPVEASQPSAFLPLLSGALWMRKSCMETKYRIYSVQIWETTGSHLKDGKFALNTAACIWGSLLLRFNLIAPALQKKGK